MIWLGPPNHGDTASGDLGKTTLRLFKVLLNEGDFQGICWVREPYQSIYAGISIIVGAIN